MKNDCGYGELFVYLNWHAIKQRNILSFRRPAMLQIIWWSRGKFPQKNLFRYLFSVLRITLVNMPGSVCYIQNLSEILKLRSCKIYFVPSYFVSYWNILKLYVEDGSSTAFLCAKFQNIRLHDFSFTAMLTHYGMFTYSNHRWFAMYSISHRISSWFCCALFCCGYIISSYGMMFSWLLLTWWHHQMETFSALLALCVGNSLFAGEFPSQRPVTRSFDIFFVLNAWVNNLEAGIRDAIVTIMTSL